LLKVITDACDINFLGFSFFLLLTLTTQPQQLNFRVQCVWNKFLILLLGILDKFLTIVMFNFHYLLRNYLILCVHKHDMEKCEKFLWCFVELRTTAGTKVKRQHFPV